MDQASDSCVAWFMDLQKSEGGLRSWYPRTFVHAWEKFRIQPDFCYGDESRTFTAEATPAAPFAGDGRGNA